MKFKVAILILFEFQFESVFGHRDYSLRSTNRDFGSCQCNYTDIFTQLPHFIQALGRDERFSFAFQGKKGEPGDVGPMGHQGYPGLEGRKGEQGSPGIRGTPGTSLMYHSNSQSSTNYSPPPTNGDMGPPGRRGQKGEPGSPTYKTVLKDGSFVEVKGEKRNMGRRGRKGDMGPPGEPGRQGLSIQGEKGGKGEPAMLPNIELLRGRPGLRGPPGPGYTFDPEIIERAIEGQKGRFPILVPVAGPPGNPGLSIVGEKGNPGQGAATVTNLHQLAENGLSRTPGTLAYVEKEETLFIRVASGWKEVMLGRFIEDKSLHLSPFQSTVTEREGFDPTAKHYFQMEKPLQSNQFRVRHTKKQRKRVQGQNVN